MRFGPDGQVIGLDVGAILTRAAALGLDAVAVAALHPAAEAGLRAGLTQTRSADPLDLKEAAHGR